MHNEISDREVAKARLPHELFLVNMIFNHVFLLIAAVMATSLDGTTLVVPVLSAAILGYTFWRAKRSVRVDSWFVVCHWQIAAKRSRIVALMWLLAGAVILGLLALSGGHLTPQHYALAGFVGLPTMGTMLVLIVLESEAMQLAGHRNMPQWARQRCPQFKAATQAAGGD